MGSPFRSGQVQNGQCMNSILGNLRSSVEVRFFEHKVKVTYALWEVTLPINWVRSHPSVLSLLERECTAAEASTDPQAADFVSLLEAQGCFTPIRKNSYTLREVRALFDPLRSAWYAIYYAHPAWEDLRSGQATRNEVIAWLVHNYHTSRAAGVAAARMASQGEASLWAPFFQQDALDEYWHCDAFYFIDSSEFCVNSRDIKSYIALPSSTAFLQHTLRLAEIDALGHLLTAYFQECSIVFEDDSKKFYSDVEAAYQLPAFFKRWKQHIQIDKDHGHAEGLAALLESDLSMDAMTVEAALRNAWISFYFLWKSLDDIKLERLEGPDILLRKPAQDGQFKSSGNNLFRANNLKQQGNSHELDDLQSLYSWHLAKWQINYSEDLRHVDKDLTYMYSEIRRASFKALSFSHQHDEIIACGRAAKLFSTMTAETANTYAQSPWAVAISNYVTETAISPTLWLMIVSLLLDRIRFLSGASSILASFAMGEWIVLVDDFRASTRMATTDADRIATALLQLDELIARWFTSRDMIPKDILD